MRIYAGVTFLSMLIALSVHAQEPLGWKPHTIKEGNGQGGWIHRSSEYRFVHRRDGKYVFPFGLAQMDNGEVLLLGSWHDGKSEKPVVAFSSDRGDTWSEFRLVSRGPAKDAGAGGTGIAAGRPMMLTDLGKGRLTFQSDKRYFSSDYGRTWNENVTSQPARGGLPWGVEGNALVDRDANGRARRIAEIGWFYEAGKKHPRDDATAAIRWSRDGCKTWKDEVRPPQWKFLVEHDGKKHLRGVSEGSIVRAANGWLVAALRTDMPPRYFSAPNDDSLEGTAVSISKDDGKTWSAMKMLFDAGRHHAHLLKLANGDLLMTLIVRDDVQRGKLASYRRGCDALISHDHGRSWNLDRRIVLDEFEFFDGEKWYNGETGHLASAELHDGSILTAYGKYLTKGVNLIRWRHAARTAKGGLHDARKKSAHRPRRIIYNNDGDDIWAKGADTVESFLALRHTPLLGTQVDSIFYCTTQSFNLFTHDTRVAEVFLSREGSFAHNNLKVFLEHKTDGLRMSCDFARKHGLEVIWSLRMNDIHDAWTPPMVSKWKQADPRRIMSTLAKTSNFNDRRRLWSLVDFEHPDVEPRLAAIVEEVLRKYPVEGIELDFLRAPFYFRTSYEGKPVTQQQAAILTRLVRRIRNTVLRESERQGKPFLLATRVPVTLPLCRRIGIDIEAWLRDSLVDVLVLGGGYVAFDQPAATLIALGHKHGVPVYPCLSQSGLMYRPPRGKGEPQPAAAWNGAALNLLNAGADGIYVFNLFPGPGSKAQHGDAIAILKTIGTKASLLQADRLFAVSDAGWSMPAHYWANDAEEFSSSLPIPLSSKRATVSPLTVTGPIASAGQEVQIELRLDFTGLSASGAPSVDFNSTPLGAPLRAETSAGVRRFSYALRPKAVGHGRNELRVGPAGDEAKLAGAEVLISVRR